MSDVAVDTKGNTAASLDEFYLFLSNLTAVEYVGNFMKRVQKKILQLIVAMQNLEDFNLDGVREYTKPLFFHSRRISFLFNAGKHWRQVLVRIPCSWRIVSITWSGIHDGESALYKCGNERYNLMVNAPEHKARAVQERQEDAKKERL